MPKLTFQFADEFTKLFATLQIEKYQYTKEIPPEYWPSCDEDIILIEKALFPQLEGWLLAKKREQERRKKRIDSYYKELLEMNRKIIVNSRSKPDVKYTVTIYKDGRKTCTCPDYVFRKRRINANCVHIQAWLNTKEGRAYEDTQTESDDAIIADTLTRIRDGRI